ncbi:putative fatty-acid--CoA ligase FadD10 [Phlyctochytrium planicorne]|nr:putative fatty-acid--CoA ligase FadD10 [Phlyctochytrium planicorne]
MTKAKEIIFKAPGKAIAIPDLDVNTYVLGHAAAKHANRVLFIDSLTGKKITVGDFVQQVERFASGLVRVAGVKKWDVVGIYAPNHFDYGVVVHGIIRAGATVTSANPSYTAPELAHQLRDSGAKSLFTVPELLPAATQACAEVGIPVDRIYLLSSTLPAGTKIEMEALAKTLRTFNDFVAGNERIAKVKFSLDELRNAPAYICYSSGTTGKPKGVVTTHYNMVSNIAQGTELLATSKDGKPGDTWVGVLPFFHMYGLNLSLHTAILNGISVVVISKFELEPFLTALEKYKVVTAHIVPPIAVALAKHPIVDKFNLSALKIVFSGAAPLGKELSAEVANRLKVKVFQGYGMTELSPIATMATSNLNADGGVGYLVPNMEARLVSPTTGEDVGVGQEGELWLRGPNVMKGYHKNEAATTSTITSDGWLKTGDVAVVDSKGIYYIVDRIKELIKYKGFQVAPAELEAYLLSHPAVADCAVIPRPDEAAGELPRAYVVLKPQVKCTEADLQKFIEGKVAPHKRLRGGVEFIDVIPKSPSGKILRRVLRDMDAAQTKAKAKL